MSSKILETGVDTQLYSWTPVAASAGAETEQGGEAGLFGATRPQGSAPPDSVSDRGANPELEADLKAGRFRIAQLEQEVMQAQARLPDEKRVAYQDGLERGETNATAKWADAMLRVTRTLADLAQHKPRLRREVEHDAVRLALAIARKVLHRELAVDPEAIAGLVRVAFEKVNVRDVLGVRVAAADAPFVTAKFASFAIPERIEIVPDPALERGSILLDLNQGQVDASVSTQLDEIERGLTDALDRSGG